MSLDLHRVGVRAAELGLLLAVILPAFGGSGLPRTTAAILALFGGALCALAALRETGDWEAVQALCRAELLADEPAVLESSPERELIEEFPIGI